MITHLPFDILFIILDKLDLTDLLNLSRSSHSLRQVAALRLWRTVSIGVNSNALFGDLPSFFVEPMKYRLKRHDLSITVIDEREYDDLISTACKTGDDNVLANVQTIRIDGMSVGPEARKLLRTLKKSAGTISNSDSRSSNRSVFSSWGFGKGMTFDKLISILARRCTSLRVLEYTPRVVDGALDLVAMNQILDIFYCVPSVRLRLTVSQLSSEVLEGLANRGNVTALSLYPTVKAPSAKELLQLGSKVERLELTLPKNDWTAFNDQTLATFLGASVRLKTVVINGGFAINGLSWLPRSVVDLTLRSTDGLSLQTLNSLDNVNLKRLELSFTSSKVFKLINCPNLDTLILHNHRSDIVANQDVISEALQRSTNLKTFHTTGISIEVLMHFLQQAEWKLHRLQVNIPPYIGIQNDDSGGGEGEVNDDGGGDRDGNVNGNGNAIAVDQHHSILDTPANAKLRTLGSIVAFYSQFTLQNLVFEGLNNYSGCSVLNLAGLFDGIVKSCRCLETVYFTAPDLNDPMLHQYGDNQEDALGLFFHPVDGRGNRTDIDMDGWQLRHQGRRVICELDLQLAREEVLLA